MTRYDAAKIMAMEVLYKLAVLSGWKTIGNANLAMNMVCQVCDKPLKMHKTVDLGICIKIAVTGQRGRK